MIWWLPFLMNLNAAACLPVSSDQILAADLARSVPEFAIVPRDAVIAFAPTPGSRRIFHSSELHRLALKFGVSLDSDREACFDWPLHPISREDVIASMRRSLALSDLHIDNAHIEIIEIGTHAAPQGRIVFPLSGLLPAADRNNGPALWRGYVIYSGKRRFDIWARLKLSAPTTRIVALNSIPVAHTIAATDVRLETVEDFPIWHEAARHLDEVVGRIARRGIESGRTVMRADLAQPIEIKAGDVVEVEVDSGKARLRMQGRAENSGHTGDVISIRNQRSGKLFRARVEGKGQVLVMPGVTGGVVN